MKKTIGIIVFLALSLGMNAQVWQDAYLFSENNYIGTSRSAAMGNAMTALGGDPGSLTFNPAGSSVASYSQIYFGSGLSISSAYATGTVAQGANDPVGFGDEVTSHRARYKMPNAGVIVNMDTGRRSGLKRMSFGMAFNTTNDYTHRFNAAGVNSDNSFAASLASGADGYSMDVMKNAGWMETGDASRMPRWIDMVGFRSGMISGVTGNDGAYIALTEEMDDKGGFHLAHPIYQEYGRQTRGFKGDILFNWSANWSDKFFLGVNLGVVTMAYSMVQYWEEKPETPSEWDEISFSDGSKARFESLVMKHNYKMTGDGVYAKIGAIWVPMPSVRLGAAIQTPTATSIIEKYSYTGQSKLSGQYRGSVSSDEDTWGYSLSQPFRYNLGAAFALGKIALVSADYEYANYSHSRFGNYNSDPEDDYVFSYYDFSDTNDDIRAILGPSHALRAGLEVKPVPGIALRAGYVWQGSGIRDGVVVNGVKLHEDPKQTYSFGLGYSSPGAFYADFALRFRLMPTEFVVPYEYYYAPDSSNPYQKVVDDGVLTPEISVDSTIADAFLTVGWRF